MEDNKTRDRFNRVIGALLSAYNVIHTEEFTVQKEVSLCIANDRQAITDCICYLEDAKKLISRTVNTLGIYITIPKEKRRKLGKSEQEVPTNTNEVPTAEKLEEEYPIVTDPINVQAIESFKNDQILRNRKELIEKFGVRSVDDQHFMHLIKNGLLNLGC